MATVILHGLGQGPESWNGVAGRLGAEVPDLFGLVRGGAVDYAGLRRGAAEYCGGLDGPLRLCGLSLGGVLALQYAIEHPERVEALALIGTQYVMPKALLAVQNLMFRLLPAGAFREMGLTKSQAAGLARSMMDLDFREELDRVSCPVLVLCGERDRANRKAAEGLSRRLPRAELAWAPGAGHEVNRDAPEALAERLEDFFRRNGGSAPQ